jgi:DNA (cytosine-5)-methyltransferase 1
MTTARRPKLLDLFCGAGGCAMGYHRAGFDVVGIDIKKQKRYPFKFVQDDVMDVLRNTSYLNRFDVIHASPPCQCYSVTKHLSNGKHPDLVAPVRELLLASGKPYVIENVVGAPLIYPVQLCGSSFGLDLRRHRLFESNMLLRGKKCRHRWQTPRFESADCRRSSKTSVVIVAGHDSGMRMRRPAGVSSVITVVNGGCAAGGVSEWRRAMEIDWMTRDELAQAIPPAYTEYLGKQIIRILSSPTRSPFCRQEAEE